jgi:membrane protein
MYLTQITTTGFAVIFFALIFKILPDVHARWKDVLVGAVVTTLLFSLGKYLIGLYLSTTGIEATYRAAGTMIVFVIWVYYNIQTILLGAVFTQVYTEMFGGRILPYRFVELREMSGLQRFKDPETGKKEKQAG